MSESDPDKKTAQLEPELRDMKIEERATANGEGAGVRVKVEDDDRPGRTTSLTIPRQSKSRSTSQSQSPIKPKRSTSSSPANEEREEVLGGDITLKMEPGKVPKLSRTASHKVVSRPPPLFLDEPDVTEEAKNTFMVLSECTYINKYIGTTEHAFECDCSEEWGMSAAVIWATVRC
jgi:[histone H3]-lysine36 N-trimethyltransferase